MADASTNDDGGIDNVRPSPSTARRIALMTYDELLSRPAPEWIIDDIVPQGSLAVLWGLPATGKSFVALSMALSVATGEAWLGRAAKRPGPVVYVAAEGDRGVPRRIQSWLLGRELQVAARVRESLRVVAQPIQFLHFGETALIEQLAALQLRPRFVVFDTMSRCMAGGEENSSREMSRLVEGCDAIRAATDATVLLVHHADKSGNTSRGSSVLHGAADTMIHVVMSGDGNVRLSCTKQKDAEEFQPIAAKLEVVQLDAGKRETSCQIVPSYGGDNEGRVLRPAALKVCEVLLARPNDDGVTVDQLANLTALNRKTIYNAVSQAKQTGYVRGVPETRPRRFVATDKLRERSSPSSPSFSASSPTVDHPTSPSSSPLKGETERRRRGESSGNGTVSRPGSECHDERSVIEPAAGAGGAL